MPVISITGKNNSKNSMSGSGLRFRELFAEIDEAAGNGKGDRGPQVPTKLCHSGSLPYLLPQIL